MKKQISVALVVNLLVALVALVAVYAASNPQQGWGKKQSVSGTTAVLAEFAPAATMLVLFNNGMNDLDVLFNCSTNDFETAVSNGTVLVIAPTNTLRLEGVRINNFWMRNAGGAAATNVVYANAR